MATKYYRAVKENSSLFKGAILKEYDSTSYRPIGDLWDRVDGLSSDVKFSAKIVENNPDWYERVYEMPGQPGVFATQDVARAVYNRMFSAGEK